MMAMAGIGTAVAADDVYVDITAPAEGAIVAEGDKVAGTVGAGATADAWNVVFVVDNSGSTLTRVNDKSVFEWEQKGALSLLKSLQTQTNNVDMGVVYFGTDAKGFGLTNDMKQIESWLGFERYASELAGTGGGTTCETGLREATKLLDGAEGNKRIYFLTDGQCNDYGEDLPNAAKEAKNKGIDVRAIHTTESSEQCQSDDLNASSCTYSQDPSKLAAELPKELAGEVKSLELVITDADGKAVATEDMTGILDGSLQQDWEYALPGLPEGDYTIEATATGEDGVKATDKITITVGKEEPKPTEAPKPSEEPKPTEAPKPSEEPKPTETKKPVDNTKKPGLPKTGN